MRVGIVTPYSGNVELNIKYLIECLKDSILRGEYPFAGHLFYTRFLDDSDPIQRAIGMMAGREWMRMAEAIAVYKDLGISSGMEGDINYAKSFGIPLVDRFLPQWQSSQHTT